MPKGKPANKEIYIKERLKGKSQIDAYRKACPDSTAKGNAPYEIASRMEDKVQARLEELKRKADAGAVMSLQQALAALADIAADPDASDAVKLSALDKIIKAAGGYTDRHEISMNGTLSIDDKRAAARAWIDKVTGNGAETP